MTIERSQISMPIRARIVDQGSRLLGKMQGYVQGHTPLETQRVCDKAALLEHISCGRLLSKCLGQMLTQ